MTATLERWWTPAGAIPVSRLLRSGTDPEKDLGLALLAVHKAGAEACELVARTAVADEYVLASALAETRKITAPMAVQVVSKGVGGTQYAGLLLRDVLDDAEVAAVAFYRTCLSKNVAPPIAAQRVGMVYGVPSREMAKYASVASDPKSNPALVADLADRTLFDYVAKMVAEEYIPVKESFAKAPGPQRQTDYEDDHNVAHGEGGRYEADPEPEVVAPAGPKKIKQLRQLKQIKQIKRITRPEDAQQGAMQQGAQQQGVRQQGLRQLSAQQQGQQQIAFLPPPLPLAGQEERYPGDMTEKLGHTKIGTPLNKAVSFILPLSEFLSVTRHSKKLNGGMIGMRVGPLERYAGKAREYGQEGAPSDHHMAGVEHVAHVVHGGLEYREQADVVTRSIPGAEIPDDAALRYHKEKFLKDLMEIDKTLRINIADEIGTVFNAPDINNPSNTVLVWRPPSKREDGSVRPALPPATIVELVIPANEIGGHVDERKRVELTSDDVLATVNLTVPSPNGRFRQSFWDPKFNAFRSTLVMRNDVSEVEKAQAERAEDYLEDHHVTNSPETGQFVSTGVSAPKKPKQLKQIKQLRQLKRVTGPVEQGARQQGALQQGAQQQGSQEAKRQVAIAQLGRKQAMKDGKGEDLLNLTDNSDWLPLNQRSIQSFLNMAGSDREWDADTRLTQVPLNVAARAFLAEHQSVAADGPTIENDLQDKARAHWQEAVKIRLDATPAEISRVTAPVTRQNVKHLDDLEYIGKAVAGMFTESPDASVLIVTTEARADGSVDLTIRRNIEAQPHQHVFKLEDCENPYPNHDKVLIPGETFRMHNASSIEGALSLWVAGAQRDNKTPGVAGATQTSTFYIANPYVKVWTVQ